MRILLVHDDESTLLAARRALRPSHLIWHVTMVTSADGARAALARRAYDVVVADDDVREAAHIVHAESDAKHDAEHDAEHDANGTEDVESDARAPRIPMRGAVDLVARIEAAVHRRRSTSMHASSLSDALARAVITHAVVMAAVA